MIAAGTCFTTANNLNISEAVDFAKNLVCRVEVAKHGVERRNRGDSCVDELLGTSGITEKKEKEKEKRRKGSRGGSKMQNGCL